MTNANFYPISHNVQVIADYWSNLHFRLGYLSLILSLGVNPKLTTKKFGLKQREHRSVVWCTTRFDIINRLGVDYKCDRQTDRQADGRTDGRTDRQV